jgi:hypothetical protein
MSIRLRIWGSGVRISPGAPALSTHLPCKKYRHFTGIYKERARANFAANASVHRVSLGLRHRDGGIDNRPRETGSIRSAKGGNSQVVFRSAPGEYATTSRSTLRGTRTSCRRVIDLIWVRTLKELMDGERRAKPPPLQTFDQGKAAQELSAGRQFCCPLQMNPEGRAEFTDQHVALG